MSTEKKLRDTLAFIANCESEANGDYVSNEDAQSNLNACVECGKDALDLLEELLGQ